METQQLNLYETNIKTVCIEPTKDIPYEIFKTCWHLSYCLEHCERTKDGLAIWDEDMEVMYSESQIEAEYLGLQNDYFKMTFEIPEAFYNRIKDGEIK